MENEQHIHIVKPEDLETVARTAVACKHKLTDTEWAEVWQRLRQGTSPYCVLADMGIAEVDDLDIWERCG